MARKVLLISPYGEEIAGCFAERDEVTWKLEPHLSEGYDWVVLYGCRKLIKEPWLTTYKGRMINIHISYLPYNRGADPNFWSWFNNTLKGVSIHEVDSGMDTGPIIAQAPVHFSSPEKHTLRTSYDQLRKAVRPLFSVAWREISKGNVVATPQNLFGLATHKSSDKTKWMDMLPMKWDTPVLEVQQLGEWQQ